MRVLHIIKGLGLAGAENHLILLLAGLREQGLDARLLLWVSPTRQADDVVEAAHQHGIPIECWTMPHHLDLALFRRLVAYLHREKPDIVHTHLVHAETYGIPAAKLAGIRHIVNSSHNDDPFRRRWFFRPRNWLLWRLTSHGIAISEHIRQFLIQVETAHPDQITTIHYGLPLPEVIKNRPLLDELGLSPETHLVGSVCRLVPQKGLSDALQAMSILMKTDSNLHYVLAGEGILREELENLAVQLGIRERVHFLGWRRDIPALMASFDIFLAPSLWEGFGLVFLEAMGQARPIIATNVSAIPEIILDGETGFLVPPHNPEQLAQALQKLLADTHLSQQMGANGRIRLETVFSPATMIQKTIAIYQQVVRA